MESLRPPSGGGRPRRIDATRERIRAIALARPRDLGEPGTRWSLPTLRRYLVRQRVSVDLQGASAPRVALDGDHRPADPHLEVVQRPAVRAKKSWVLGAYKAAEAGTLDGVLVCFDECGPISLKPHAGRVGSTKGGRPASGPPTTPDRGAQAAGRLRRGRRPAVGTARGPLGDRQGGLEFLKDIRRRYPAETTVYIVMDNLSAHWTPAIRGWAVPHNVGLLPTPTNASHLNRIECHFWAYVEFVINGSDYPDWTEFTKATQAYIRRRNRDRHDPSSGSSKTAGRWPDQVNSYRRNDPRRPTRPPAGRVVIAEPDVDPCPGSWTQSTPRN